MDALIDLVIKVIQGLIFLRIIISWIMPSNGRGNEFVNFIYQITEPLLAPFRIILPIGRLGGMDLSPIILLFVLDLIRNLLIKIL